MMFKTTLNHLVKQYQITTRLNSTSVYIVDGVRTPIGSYKGQLKNFKATELGAIAVKNLLDRTKVSLFLFCKFTLRRCFNKATLSVCFLNCLDSR